MKLKDNAYIITFFIALTIFTLTTINELKKESDYIQIEVEPGDTIWDYAEQFKGHHNLSPSDFVAWVEENNHIFNRSIQVGEVLVIPVSLND